MVFAARLGNTCTTPEGEAGIEVEWVVDASGRTARFARRHGDTRRLRYDRLVGVAAVLSGSQGVPSGQATQPCNHT